MKTFDHPYIVVAAAFCVCMAGYGNGAQAQSAPLTQGKVYVTSWFGGAVSVIDLESSRVTTTIPVGVHDHNRVVPGAKLLIL